MKEPKQIRQCAAKTPDGFQCRNIAMRDEWVCTSHAPAAQRSKIARKAAATRAARRPTISELKTGAIEVTS